MNISFRIMGVPSRMDNIRLLQSQLGIGDESVFLDTEYRRNPMWTWKHTAQLPSQPHHTHMCIVQDDAVLCNGFVEFVRKLVRRFSEDIIMPCNKGKSANRLPYGCVFQPGYTMGGQCSIVPVNYIDSIITEQERDYPDHIDDDNWLCFWAHRHNVRVLSTHPSIVTSLSGGSLIGHEGSTASLFIISPQLLHWPDVTSMPVATKRDWSKPLHK